MSAMSSDRPVQLVESTPAETRLTGIVWPRPTAEVDISDVHQILWSLGPYLACGCAKQRADMTDWLRAQNSQDKAGFDAALLAELAAREKAPAPPTTAISP